MHTVQNVQASVWSNDFCLTGTTTPGGKGIGSNDNEVVLYISQISRTGISQTDTV